MKKIMALSMLTAFSLSAWNVAPKFNAQLRDGEGNINPSLQAELFSAQDTEKGALVANQFTNYLAHELVAEFADKVIDDVVPHKELANVNVPVLGNVKVSTQTVAKKALLIALITNDNRREENGYAKKIGINFVRALIKDHIVDFAGAKVNPYVNKAVSSLQDNLPHAVAKHKYFAWVHYAAQKAAKSGLEFAYAVGEAKVLSVINK